MADPGVAGTGTASLLADLGHEVPTALLPSLLTASLGDPAAALGARYSSSIDWASRSACSALSTACRLAPRATTSAA
ncbi:MAG: hypothetical protein V7603_4801 [Micromonosporaceae bacterium]